MTHERIYRELGEDFIRRMRNWRRWWDACQGSLYPSSLAAAELGILNDRYREVTLSVLFGEGEDTELALRRVPARYQQMIRQFWLYEGRSLRSHARARGIDHHTVEAWVIKGHELLKAELARMTEAWHRKRAVAEAGKLNP